MNEETKEPTSDPVNRRPGSWIQQKDGTLLPDMSDEAMAARYNEDGTEKSKELPAEESKE